jgi:hypothetical protein
MAQTGPDFRVIRAKPLNIFSGKSGMEAAGFYARPVFIIQSDKTCIKP